MSRPGAILGNINPNSKFRPDVWLAGLTFLAPALYFSLKQQYGLILAVMFFAILLILWMRDHAAALVVTFTYLLALGDIRRIVDLIRGERGLDPLLLVGAALSLYIALPLLMRLRVSDPLSKSVFILMIIMILEMFNPKQGPLIVGVSGALFFLVPVFWFWIARRYATERILYLLFFRVFIPMGFLAALLGIYQTYIGFLPWEQVWIDSVKSQLTALYLGAGHIRSIGFSASGIEFGDLMLIASTTIVAGFFAKRRAYVVLMPILAWSILLASMRNIIVRFIFAFVMTWALSGRGAKGLIGRLTLALCLGAGLLAYSTTGSGPAPVTAVRPGKVSSSQLATSHVTNGLSHPLDSRYSTAGLHWQIFLEGITRGFTSPGGYGLGSTTLGAGKFGGTGGGISSEIDISDAFTSLGFVGGFCYLYIIFLTFKAAYHYLQKGPRYITLSLFGLLVGMLSEWIALGQYAVGPFVWFCMGFLAQQEGIRLKAIADAEALRKESLKPQALQLQSPVVA